MTTPFSARLRAATWEDHGSAEQSGFLADLTKGRLTIEAHTALTVQHYLVYEVLEEASRAMAADSIGGQFHDPLLERLPALAADLSYLAGADWRDLLVPVASTTEYTERLKEIAFTWPGGFVAHHYNRYLGDLSGGQFVAKSIAEAYGLGEDGLRFYDYSALGSLIAYKNRYRAKLDHSAWDELERGRIVDEVKLAYRLNIDVLEDLGGVHFYPFRPEVVTQIMRHMNGHHTGDSLIICRAFGGQPTATAAVMSGMDADGIDFHVTVGGTEAEARVAWSQRLTARAQVREEVTRMYHDARAKLGLPAAETHQ
jgi:heme oxygenase